MRVVAAVLSLAASVQTARLPSMRAPALRMVRLVAPRGRVLSLSDATSSTSASSPNIPPEAPAQDLTGDGGVLKTVLTPGDGNLPRRGATVEIAYVAKLRDEGSVFEEVPEDAPIALTLGEGEVITAWEVAVAAMRMGERARVVCSSSYAYGDFGREPQVPPGASLEFEITLLRDVPKPAAQRSAAQPAAAAGGDAMSQISAAPSSIPQRTSMADLARPDIARSPAEIAAAYEAKLAQGKQTPQVSEDTSLLQVIIERLRTAYIFGLFDSQTGEKAPWYLNPLITFPGMFAFVSVGIVLVKITGAVKLGVPGEAETPLF